MPASNKTFGQLRHLIMCDSTTSRQQPESGGSCGALVPCFLLMHAVVQHSLSSSSRPVCDAADVFWPQLVPDLQCMVSLSAHLTVVMPSDYMSALS